MVAPDVRHADLADHRPGRASPSAWSWASCSAASRGSTAAGRHGHPARHRDPALDPDDPALDGPGGGGAEGLDVVQVYFVITIILSLIGWTELARVVRGRFLSLREEDFVMAAELVGCEPAADHLPPHGAVVPEPHHRGDDAGAAGDDHQRDVAAASWAWACARRPSRGASCCRRRRTSRPSRISPWLLVSGGPGHHRRSWPSTSWATACATPPIRMDSRTAAPDNGARPILRSATCKTYFFPDEGTVRPSTA